MARTVGAIGKVKKEVREAAGEYSEMALAALVFLCEFGEPEIQFKAANAILDLAHGKPMQVTENTHKGSMTISWLGETAGKDGDQS